MLNLKIQTLDGHTCWTNTNTPSRWKMQTNTKEYIVIHQTGCPNVPATKMRQSFNNYPVERSAGAHYFVDNIEALQIVSPDFITWNCGDGTKTNRSITNFNSIAIELCIFDDKDRYANTLKQGSELVAYLMDTYNIPIERVKMHQDASGKMCPDYLLRGVHGYTWADFLQMAKGANMSKLVNDLTINTNGELLKYKAINIDGNNFVKLQDLQKAGIVVGYANGIPTLTTKN